MPMGLEFLQQILHAMKYSQVPLVPLLERGCNQQESQSCSGSCFSAETKQHMDARYPS